MIYLDYTANAPVEPEVLNTFCEVERRCLGNANARHSAGRQAHAEMEKAILHAADVLNVEPGGLIFTSGASESNNTAIFGIAHASRHNMSADEIVKIRERSNHFGEDVDGWKNALRESAVGMVRTGRIQGYLAFEDDLAMARTW